MIVRHAIFVLIVLAVSPPARPADLPAGATLLDSDLVWDLEPAPDPSSGTRDPTFVISPDDKSIAYISKGAVWKCDVTAGPTRKIADLPNTTSALLATPENRAAWNNLKTSQPWTSRDVLEGKLGRAPVAVHSLAWTPDQDGVVFTLSEGIQGRPWTVTYQVMHAPGNGVVTPIAKFTRNAYGEPNHFTIFHVTRDKKYVVASNGYTPMIWVAATNKPRATCFDVLVPSSTSGRFLGIEIDTRQLVIADEDFKIVKRFGAIFQSDRHCDLLWSADERYTLCRERLEHPSSEWVGFRMDLQTGKQRELSGSDFSEECFFTGNGGELIRIPPRYGPVKGMKFITLVPDGTDRQREVIPWPIMPSYSFPPKFGRYPAANMSRDGRLFALAFMRESRVPGYRFFLVDREARKIELAPDDESVHVSPYHVIAIANGGKTIVACDDSRLFSIPIEKIKNAQSQAAK
jgi:hypothetical protein